MNSNKQRLLLITYSYSPHLTPRAIRWSAISSYLVDNNFIVDVICSYDPGLESYENDHGVHIHRVGSGLIEKIRFLINKRTAFNMNSNNSENNYAGTKSSIKSRLTNKIRFLIRGVYKATWPKVFWPDYACLWYFYARSKAKKLLAEYNYSAVISVSPPFTGHIVGEWVKRENPGLKWIVDVGDPFCFEKFSPMNNQLLYFNYNKKREKKIFQLADEISVTNNRTKQIYTDIFRHEKNNIHVIGPLYTPSKYERTKLSDALLNKKKINMVYVGNFHEKTREPGPLLEFFNTLINVYPELATDLIIHFLGNKELLTHELGKYPLLNKIVYIHGPQNRTAVLSAINESDYLINAGNNNSYQLPSKVVEYMSTGKPIINISIVHDDLGAEILSEYPRWLNVQLVNKPINYEKCYKFISDNQHFQANQSVVDKITSPYMLNNIGKQYKGLITNI